MCDILCDVPRSVRIEEVQVALVRVGVAVIIVLKTLFCTSIVRILSDCLLLKRIINLIGSEASVLIISSVEVVIWCCYSIRGEYFGWEWNG